MQLGKGIAVCVASLFDDKKLFCYAINTLSALRCNVTLFVFFWTECVMMQYYVNF